MKIAFGLAVSAAAGAFLLGSVSANATVFSFDEFFIEKGASAGHRSEIFRDSFNDGAPPPSGPEDAIPGLGGVTYSTFGGGFLSENVNGRLLVDSSLGGLTGNPNGDLRRFNRARRIRSTNPSSSAVLDEGSSWTVNALLDLSVLPQNPGEAFGIRVEDHSGSNANAGNDRIALEVRRSNTTGSLGVSFNGLDFFGVPIENFDFFLLQPLLDNFASVEQILLSITKEENTKTLEAEFSLFDNGAFLASQSLDNIGNNSGLAAQVFSDEAFTRAAITTIERAETEIPEPGAVGLLAAGVAGIGFLRRRVGK